MSLPDFSTQAELFSTAGLSASLFAPTDRYRLFAKVVYPHLVRARSSLEPCYCADNGRLALEPVLMLGVSLLQYLDGVPDRQAVELLRYHAGWNFALNRQLGDPAFHPSSLVNFRNRLEQHQQSALAFTAVLEALQEVGLVLRQNRQRLDSTQMLGRVARMSRLDCVRETLRLALQELEGTLRPEGRPVFWLGLWERYVESQTDYRASSETLARKLVEAGSDAWQLLQWLDQPEGAALTEGPQLRLLRRVFAEQFEIGVGPATPAPREKIRVASDSPGSEAAPLAEAQAPAAQAPAQAELSVVSSKAETAVEPGALRLQSNPQSGTDADQLSQAAPDATASGGTFIQPKAKADLGSERVQNPHEPEATYAAKGQGEKKKEHVGYKVQVAETVCEATLAAGEPTRNFIVGMVTHPAYESDEAGAQKMESEQSVMGLEKPAVQYVDGAYVSAEKLVEAAAQGRQLIGPAAAPPNNNDSRFTTEAFQIEVEHRQATCPAGHPNSQCSRLEEKATGKVSYRLEWDTATCAACPLRQQCIKAEQKHRTLVVGEHHTALQTRRQEQRTAAFKEQMKHRNGIEGTQSELVRGHGLRQARYRGLAKAKLQNYFIGAACNVKRWLRRLAWELEEAVRASRKTGTVLAS